MKILVICQYYYPEPFRVNDYCEELVKRGHQVTVITGTPNYPMGKIYAGYDNGKKSDEVINGVTVHRCPIVGRKTGALHRFINYYDFVFKSKKYVSKLDDSFDIVFVNQLSPVMMAEAGVKYKKKHGKKLVLYCLDLWPESLVAGGIKRGSAIHKIFGLVSKRIYKEADKILITSKSFADYFKSEFGIADTVYMPQYAEAIFSPEICKKKENDTVDLMFAGNVGAAQSVKTIVEAARLTKEETTLHWHIVGDGSELENLKKQAAGLTNITFNGRLPLEKMPEYYSMADAMIVTMEKNPVLSLTLPGKVQTYMAAGKPIVGAIDGETKLVIEEAKCGYVCGADDATKLAHLAKAFKPNEEMCKNARCFYEEHFAKNNFVDILEKQLRKH